MYDDRQGVLPVFMPLEDAAMAESFAKSATQFSLASQTLIDRANLMLLTGLFKEASEHIKSASLYSEEAKRQIGISICLTDGLPIDINNRL